MNPSHRIFVVFLFLMITQPSLGCGFCSSKKAPLSGGNMAAEPGQANRALNPMPSVIVNNSPEARPANSFSYDLRNYQPTGQRSEDPNWTSEINK
ncbi:MAG: hypothetical protein EB078_09375 [Proteobacteria bacterium]|nr:hypothetical protein [Pseudomonadota bacterium]NDC25288.1 hypothetical protein [Pseudomonadota bacterium]NDD05106.1 hypothetical protein [Pseudomonadota bacterium]